MEPFFFGTTGHELLGIYHPPTGADKAGGVVVCPPLFGEYLRSHGCLRRIATSLAANGHHVLRFDYFGTGDSAGDFSETDPSSWAEDIETAVAELKDIAGVQRIRLLGVRLSATMVAQLIGQDDCIQRIVLWDPVMSGADYIAQLRNTHRKLLAAHNHGQRRNRKRRDDDQSLVGFRVSQRLVQHVSQLEMPLLSAALSRSGTSAAIVLSQKDYSYGPLLACAAADNVSIDKISFDCDWTTYSESVLYPRDIERVLAERV